MIIISLIAIGIISGVVGGLIGVGGGIIIIPGLLFLFKALNITGNEIAHQALSTSLASIILPTMRASYIHFKNKNINWKLIPSLAPGVIFGTIAGVLIATKLSADFLEVSFGLFLLIVAIKMLKSRRNIIETTKFIIPKLLTWSFGVVTGLLSGLLGIGGGTLLIPFFNYNNYSIHKSISTSSFLIGIISIIGTITYTFLGFINSANYIYWPGVIWISLGSVISVSWGVEIGKIISEKTLRITCSSVFIVIACKLILKNF
ncbi:MAG: sulfite exporter TauE/SafE family protein [Alphaproteobacteria bacterium]